MMKIFHWSQHYRPRHLKYDPQHAGWNNWCNFAKMSWLVARFVHLHHKLRVYEPNVNASIIINVLMFKHTICVTSSLVWDLIGYISKNLPYWHAKYCYRCQQNNHISNSHKTFHLRLTLSCFYLWMTLKMPSCDEVHFPQSMENFNSYGRGIFVSSQDMQPQIAMLGNSCENQTCNHTMCYFITRLANCCCQHTHVIHINNPSYNITSSMANLLKSSTNIWATMKVLVIAFVVGVDFLGLSTNVNQPLILMFGIIKWNYSHQSKMVIDICCAHININD